MIIMLQAQLLSSFAESGIKWPTFKNNCLNRRVCRRFKTLQLFHLFQAGGNFSFRAMVNNNLYYFVYCLSLSLIVFFLVRLSFYFQRTISLLPTFQLKTHVLFLPNFGKSIYLILANS